MKKIFVCEFITCGGMRGIDLPVSLVKDAETMLHALLADLQEIDDMEVVTCRDSRLPSLAESGISIKEDDDVHAVWLELMREADWIWIIAPESKGELLRLVELARTCSGRVIACSSAAIRLTSSKMKTYKTLHRQKLIVPETRYLTDELLDSDTGWVVKPDDGAGSENCYLFEDEKTIRRFAQTAAASQNFIQQRFINGSHLSLSAVFAYNRVSLLSCNHQEIIPDASVLSSKVIRQQVGDDCENSFKMLVENIAKQIPGLRAYVGIDLVLNDQGPVVLDINPRLTTSYAGLSALLGFNVAELILENFEKDGCRE